MITPQTPTPGRNAKDRTARPIRLATPMRARGHVIGPPVVGKFRWILVGSSPPKSRAWMQAVPPFGRAAALSARTGTLCRCRVHGLRPLALSRAASRLKTQNNKRPVVFHIHRGAPSMSMAQHQVQYLHMVKLRCSTPQGIDRGATLLGSWFGQMRSRTGEVRYANRSKNSASSVAISLANPRPFNFPFPIQPD